jgi:hypothetical protein
MSGQGHHPVAPGITRRVRQLQSITSAFPRCPEGAKGLLNRASGLQALQNTYEAYGKQALVLQEVSVVEREVLVNRANGCRPFPDC